MKYYKELQTFSRSEMIIFLMAKVDKPFRKSLVKNKTILRMMVEGKGKEEIQARILAMMIENVNKKRNKKTKKVL